jgi:hypothetical protein
MSRAGNGHALEPGGRNNLWHMRRFYIAFPDRLHAPRGELSRTHYRLLLKVQNPKAYVREAAGQRWSTGELELRINLLFYERAAPDRRESPWSVVSALVAGD